MMEYQTHTGSGNDRNGRPNVHTGTNSDGTTQWYADYNGLRYECTVTNSEFIHVKTHSIDPICTVLSENNTGIPASSKWGIPKNVLGKIYATWENLENRE